MSNHIPQKTTDVITYSCINHNQSLLVNWAPCLARCSLFYLLDYCNLQWDVDTLKHLFDIK